jgi:hypothetical protein
MLPTDDQIRQAAFDRWRRRGWIHGFEREDWFAAENELAFDLNYQTLAEYPLLAPGTLVLSDRPTRYCRFCERTSAHASFGPARPVVVGAGRTSLYTEAICEECQSLFRNKLAGDFSLFQDALLGRESDGRSREPSAARSRYSTRVFKSLVVCALMIMPESELRYFVDTLEWVSNPDPVRDGLLLREEATCLVYSADFLRERAWTSLARRTDNEAALPYMIFFLAQCGVVLQVRLPLCIRDQELDGRPVRFPRRSFVTQEGRAFEQARLDEFRIT